MKPKLIIGVLFLITFVVSFTIYLVVVTFIAPLLDLSTSAKKDLEVAPELKGINLPNGSYQRLRNAHIPTDDEGSYSSNSTKTEDKTQKPSNDQEKPANENSENKANNETSDQEVSTDNLAPQPEITAPPPPIIPVKPVSSGSNQQNATGNSGNTSAGDQSNMNNADRPVLDKTLNYNNGRNASPASVNKVIIGSYATVDEAKQATTGMSALNINPVIKQVNGKYTVQAGAFSSKDKAERRANKLKASNYEATVRSE